MASSSGRPPPPPPPSSGEKRPRNDHPSSPSEPNSASAKNPRRSSPFADFGSYMAEKNRKLTAQFEADASSSLSAGGGVFSGVSIFVDGFTIPSSQELKEIMLNNGGRVVNYFSRHTVTHIVCSNLADSKMRNLRAFSRGLPVVKPAWVVDSLAENRLLSCVPYQISERGSSSRKQMKLSAFFSQKHIGLHNQEEQIDRNSTLENEAASSQGESLEQPRGGDNDGSLSNEEISKDSLSSDEHKVSACEEQDSENFAIHDHENAFETACSGRRDNDIDGKYDVIQPPDVNSRRLDFCSTSHISCHYSLGPFEKTGTKPSSRPHSTLTDPNFVENYFKYSRLHFIGTWRNRYRKRFSNLLGAKSLKVNNDHSGMKKTIIHIDMDCFFVSVIIRNMPELHDKPVAVCHSDNPKGTAEISSANYPARNYGIKAGIFVRDAKARCPHLVIVPYNFEAYEEVADQFYGILHKHCNKVQALSCDEAFLDMTECLLDNPEEVALIIRNEIFDITKCTASAGIAENMLLARLATRSAKPNGQCYIPSEKVDDYLNKLPVKALPGIGHAVSNKLKSREVEYCGQLRIISKETLHKNFGKKICDMLWNFCRGIDHSVVEAVQETKSVGAEVNWGVRFNDNKDAEHFLANLCKEVSLRLQGCGVGGRTITLKVKTRRKGADEPVKFLGCGDCETMSRSMTIAGATDNLATLQRIAKQLFSTFHVDVNEVRGVGLKMSKLEPVDLTRAGLEGNMLESWLVSPSEKLKKQYSEKTCVLEYGDTAGLGTCKQQDNGISRSSSKDVASHPSEANIVSDRSGRDHAVELPPLSHLDVEVLKNLPPEIISEMNDVYKGELHSFLDMHSNDKGTESTSKSPVLLPAVAHNSLQPVCDAKLHACGDKNSMSFEKEDMKATMSEDFPCPRENKKHGTSSQCKHPTSNESERMLDNLLSEVKAAYASSSIACELVDKTAESVKQFDLMPGSLSQADFKVLQELPEDVKADLFNVLPLHRSGDPTSSNFNGSGSKFPRAEGTEDPKYSKSCLLSGSYPKWIEQFRASGCFILNVIAEQHTNFSSSDPLSSVLLSVASFLPFGPRSGSNEWDEALSCLSELLTQYIHLKVESDIEELHTCFRLLKRFSSASELFLELHNNILPFLQDSVNQHYGGTLYL